MLKNPDAMAALLVLGHRLGKKRLPGETGVSRMSEALMHTNAQMGRSQALRQQLFERKQAMMMDLMKAQLEDYKARSGRMTAEAATTRAEAAKQTAGQSQALQGLKVQELKAKIGKLKAEADKELNGPTLQQQWQTLVNELLEVHGDWSFDMEKVKSAFRDAHDLPDNYVLGLGGATPPPVTGAPAAPTASITPDAKVGVVPAVNQVTAGKGTPPTGGTRYNSRALQYGRVYGANSAHPRMWVGHAGADVTDPKNWRDVK
jgi:hypothetical protein